MKKFLHFKGKKDDEEAVAHIEIEEGKNDGSEIAIKLKKAGYEEVEINEDEFKEKQKSLTKKP